MVYKNGLKEYSLITVLFGVPMGILFGLSKLSFIVGVVSGVLSGLLFTLLMFLFIKVQEKKFDKKRIEIAKERRIICDGLQNDVDGSNHLLNLEWSGIRKGMNGD